MYLCMNFSIDVTKTMDEFLVFLDMFNVLLVVEFMVKMKNFPLYFY
jgi:hypothetical protein